ncbi:MAG: glycosyltransferase family 4 protein [Roseiflexaceae bacterium]
MTASYHIGFVLEQALGHVTHSQNLRANVLRDPQVQALWGLVPWETAGLAQHIPVYKTNWTVRAGLRARRALQTMARGTPIDALFFHTQVPAVLARDWIARIPSVISLDATPLQYDTLGQFYNHASGPRWFEQIKWRIQRDCFRAARWLVTWSEWARQGLISDYGVAPERVHVIPPGVNVDEWAAPTARQAGEGPVKILFVGGDLERKGGRVLLEAFAALRPLGAELHLVTRDRVEPAPGVFVYQNIKPNSPELRRLYQTSQVFCLPTYGDCLPMALAEAGAAGLPCVSARVAGIPEIVRDGETGALITPGSSEELAAALRRLVQNPELRLRQGRAAQAHVARHHDARRNAVRLLDLLKQTAGEPRRALGVA